ncbi:MAG TPA: adenylate/guanylate cyclase domain-containing protein, partial [Magnetospirillaceae bacterium]|nr:adenylate/guanylate cyclase domain-containing protein [Magnetospirillaceae bacterium]
MKILALLSILAWALTVCGCALAPGPTVEAGVLDLRGAGGPLPLTGLWLVDRGDGPRPGAVPLRSILPAPAAPAAESWTVTVLFPAGAGGSLFLPFPAETGEVWLNFKLLWDPSAAGGGVGQALIQIPPAPSAVLRVDIPRGGRSLGAPALFTAPILLGTPEAVRAYRSLTDLMTGIKTGAFGSALLVSLLFALLNRRGAGFLSLAAYLAGTLAYILVRDGHILGSPALGSAYLERLYTSSWSLQFAGLAVLAPTLFHRPLPSPVRLPIAAPPLAMAGAALLPLPLVPVHAAVLGWAALSIAVLAYCSGIRSLRGDTGALPVFLGATILAAAYGARFLVPDSLLLALIFEPAGAGAFAILASLTIIRKVGKAFDEVENLSIHLGSVASSMKRFIPAEFLDFLQKAEITDLRLGDHVRKDMTIFFSDIRGFTLLSETLTEEETFAFINSYLARMVPIIRERGGFVDKYVGDAIMALFPHSAGADRALRASLDMHDRLLEYNRHRASVGYSPIEMGIGIHTGALMLGVVGVQDRMENTVISDAVNLASRLQAIAKAFNIGVVISEQSFKS